MRLALIALFLTACTVTKPSANEPGPGSAATPRDAALHALGLINATDLAAGEAPTPDGVRADLAGARKAAQGAEAQALEALQAALAGIAAGDAKALSTALTETQKAFPTDFEIQLRTTTTLAVLEGSAPLPAAQALAQKFPNEARAQAHLAAVTAAESRDSLAAMRSYARCLELTPNARSCRTGFNTLAASYTTPRCTELAATALALHPAFTAKTGKATQPATVADQKLFMEPAPAITGSDVSQVTEVGGDVAIWLTPTGAARFAELTRALAQTQGFLVMIVSGKTVAAPKVMSAIDSGRIQLTKAQGVSLKSLCKKIDVRALPDDLAKIK